MVVIASHLNWVARRPVREAREGEGGRERDVGNTTLTQETMQRLLLHVHLALGLSTLC